LWRGERKKTCKKGEEGGGEGDAVFIRQKERIREKQKNGEKNNLDSQNRLKKGFCFVCKGKNLGEESAFHKKKGGRLQ